MASFGQVVGVTGDADTYCLACARRQYGDDVTTLLAGTPYDYATDFNRWYDSLPHDNEGNTLGVLIVGQNDYDADAGAPFYCGVCFSPIA